MLRGVNAQIRNGEKIGIVGTSAAACDWFIEESVGEENKPNTEFVVVLP